mmetsp:Transcript_5888/g.14620  ORF Transcript_5888/g.14620 Transcript_5888/m.14620 type:complete len:97 (-) Transcript_5888:210-500(-)
MVGAICRTNDSSSHMNHEMTKPCTTYASHGMAWHGVPSPPSREKEVARCGAYRMDGLCSEQSPARARMVEVMRSQPADATVIATATATARSDSFLS